MKNRVIRLFFVVVFLSALGLSPQVFANIFDVNKTDDTDDGSCLAAPAGDCSLREAIIEANKNPGDDTINIPSGTYLLTLGELEITDAPVTLNGQEVGGTIIDANKASRVFQISVSSGKLVTLNRLTIQNGYSDQYGGGINSNGKLKIIGSLIRDNTSPTGGGIRSMMGGVDIVNTTLTGNSAEMGGGIAACYNTCSQPVRLYNVTVTNNVANIGGGIACEKDCLATDFQIQNSIVAGNKANNAGGAPDCDSVIDGYNGFYTFGHNLVGDAHGEIFPKAGDIFGGIPANPNPIDPKLSPLANNGGPTFTHALTAASPAVNAGNPSGCKDSDGNILGTDQLGQPRVGVCDMGAFEFQEAPAPNVCGNGVVESGEQCEDGNVVTEFCPPNKPDCMVCDATCHLVNGQVNRVIGFCGNGTVETPEQCDDGNKLNGDGCNMNCQFEKPVIPSFIPKPKPYIPDGKGLSR